MSGGINSLRFRLQRKDAQDRELAKRGKLVQQLDKLGVKVNKPYEMDVEQLEMLVKCHRVTVESRPDYVSKEHVKIAETNGLTKEDVVNRVDNLGWDVGNAVKVKKVPETKEQQRERRKRERMLMIQKLNEMEWQNEQIN